MEEAEKIKPFQIAKRRVFQKYGISGSDKDRIFTAIMYKIYRLQGILDKALAHSLNTSLKELQNKPPLIRQALRLAAFLAQFADVKDPQLERILLYYGLKYIAKRYGWRDARLIARALSKLKKNPWKPSTIEEEYELRYMLPYWFIKRLEMLLGKNEIEALANSFNKEPPLGLRVNSLKTSVEEVLEHLRRNGITAWVSERVPQLVRYKAPFIKPIAMLVENGKAVPQDESSAIAALLLNPMPGEIIVDLCAAPGGKTTHIAELTRNTAKIIAFDLYADRLQRLRWLAVSTGTYVSIDITMSDAKYASSILGTNVADRVLLDPPCSSTGALAKHPDARWRLSPSKLEELITLQKSLLIEAVKIARKGGRILYVVCSLLPEEGEWIIKWALEKLPVKLIPLQGPYSPSPLLPGTMRAWPHRHNTTGFFYALLEKTEKT